MEIDSPVWLWLAGGVVLVALEALVPGVILMWFGLAAIVCGLLFTLVDLTLDQELLLWAALSLVALMLGRPVMRRWQAERAALADGLNDRGHALIGQTARLETPLADGRGRLRLGDNTWSATGPDLAAGTLVRVVAVHGNTLTVAAVEAPEAAPKPSN